MKNKLNTPIKRCIKCGEELKEDVAIDLFSGTQSITYCPNEKCDRYGLQTYVGVIQKENK
jgi:ArsR family metal-binding transcriptional regulator